MDAMPDRRTVPAWGASGLLLPFGLGAACSIFLWASFGKKLPVRPVSVFGLLTSEGALEISVATVNFGATSSGLACKVGVSVGITDFFGFIAEVLRKGSSCASKPSNFRKKGSVGADKWARSIPVRECPFVTF